MRAIEVSAHVPLGLEPTWQLFFGDQLRTYAALSDATIAVEDYELRPDGTPRYRMVQKTGTFTSDYSVFDAPYRTVNQVLDSPFGGTYRITHEPAGSGTRVIHRWEISARNPVLRLLLPVLRPLLARAIRADLELVARRAAQAASATDRLPVVSPTLVSMEADPSKTPIA
jgi:hypothetical protein